MPNLPQCTSHDCEASDSISKLSKARNDLFILGVENLDAKRQGQYETFQDLIDKATERLMDTGEMVGKKVGKNERDDDENDSDDENDKAKKGLQGKFALESFRGARVH